MTKRTQRPHRPDELGPRIFSRRGALAADLRPWGGGRVTLRDPDAVGWPRYGKTTRDRREALSWSWSYVHDLNARQHGNTGTVSLRAAVRRHLRTRKDEVAEGTYLTDRAAANHLLEWIEPDELVDRLHPDDFADLIADLRRRGYADSTLGELRNRWNVFLRGIGVEWSIPAPEVRSSRRTAPEGHVWSDEEVAVLRATADALDTGAGEKRGPDPLAEGRPHRWAIDLGLCVGLRVGEILGAKWDDFDARAETFTVERQVLSPCRIVPPKAGSVGVSIVLPAWAEVHDPTRRGYVVSRDGSRPLQRRTGEAYVVRVLRASGLKRPGAGAHSLRHTFARAYLERYEGTLQELQRFLRHSSVTTTESAYGHFSRESAVALARSRLSRLGSTTGRGRGVKSTTPSPPGVAPELAPDR